MTNIIIIVSFILDGLLSIYQETSIFYLFTFKPMFTIMALIIIFPFYSRKDLNYYKTCIIVGLAYDLIYTNTIFFNMLIFLLLGYLISKLYQFFSDNFLNSVIINIIIIMMYNIITYAILSLIGYLPFNTKLFISNIPGLIIINTLIFMIIYELLKDKRNKLKFNI